MIFRSNYTCSSTLEVDNLNTDCH